MTKIDWTKKGHYECSCRCGAVYGSPAAMFPRTTEDGGGFSLVSKESCPSCGKTDDLRQMRSGWEKETL